MKYPPCMMMQQPRMKEPKGRNVVKELIAMQKFMDELRNPKDVKDPPKTRKGTWAWVEDPPETRKYTVFEMFGVLSLLSVPIGFGEILVGKFALHALGFQ